MSKQLRMFLNNVYAKQIRKSSNNSKIESVAGDYFSIKDGTNPNNHREFDSWSNRHRTGGDNEAF